MLDTTRYSTPAHFTISETGNTIVHAPSDSGLQIITPATTTISSSNTFLEEDVDMLDDLDVNEDYIKDDSDNYFERKVDEKLDQYYGFLK
jgi:hypothetical protein